MKGKEDELTLKPLLLLVQVVAPEGGVRLKGIVGEEEAMKIIRGALVLISAGTNDFIFNFYDIPTRTLEFNITGYHEFLQKRLQNFIKVSMHICLPLSQFSTFYGHCKIFL